MTTWLSVIFAAFLSVALIAFGWMPCCCSISNTCCPSGGVPATMHGVFGSTCPSLNGVTITLGPGGPTSWQTAAGYSFSMLGCDTPTSPTSHNISLITVTCTGGGTWTLSFSEVIVGSSALDNACSPSGAAITVTSSQCSPFQIVFSGQLGTAFSWRTCAYAGSTWTLTVTA